jgi:hypothetical protein
MEMLAKPQVSFFDRLGIAPMRHLVPNSRPHGKKLLPDVFNFAVEREVLFARSGGIMRHHNSTLFAPVLAFRDKRVFDHLSCLALPFYGSS